MNECIMTFTKQQVQLLGERKGEGRGFKEINNKELWALTLCDNDILLSWKLIAYVLPRTTSCRW